MSVDQSGGPSVLVRDRVTGVAGGAGGQTAHLDDMRQLARFFETTAGQATIEAARCCSYATSPDLALSAPLSPGTAWEAESAILAVATGPGGALSVAARLTALAVKIEASAWAYEQAETANAALWDAIDQTAGFLIGRALIPVAVGGTVVAVVSAVAVGAVVVTDPAQVGTLVSLGGSVLARMRSPETVAAMELFATEHPALVSHLVNGSGGLMAGLDSAVLGPLAAGVGVVGWSTPSSTPLSTQELAALLAGFFHAGRFKTDIASEQPGTPEAPRTIADLAALLMSEGRPAGAMDILAVTTHLADGGTRTSYVVAIPGTEDWSLPAAQRRTTFSRDAGSNLQAIGGIETQYTKAIPEALARAGVPAGASVALVGHSQGGLIAMQAAASRTVRSRYIVTDVLTMGSPVARMTPPPGTRVVSLENTADVVCAFDGASNQDRPEQVTVLFGDETPTPEEYRQGAAEAEAGDSVGFNHSMARYHHGSQMVDQRAQAGDPVLAPVVQGLRERGYLADPGAKDPSTVQLTRVVVSVTR